MAELDRHGQEVPPLGEPPNAQAWLILPPRNLHCPSVDVAGESAVRLQAQPCIPRADRTSTGRLLRRHGEYKGLLWPLAELCIVRHIHLLCSCFSSTPLFSPTLASKKVGRQSPNNRRTQREGMRPLLLPLLALAAGLHAFPATHRHRSLHTTHMRAHRLTGEPAPAPVTGN